MNNTYNVFQVLLFGILQGSILGPILFNIFINDLLLSIENAELHNFADDNTISCTEKSWLAGEKNLDFRWSKKAKITLETISFWQNVSISILKFSPFLLLKSYQFFKIY